MLPSEEQNGSLLPNEVQNGACSALQDTSLRMLELPESLISHGLCGVSARFPVHAFLA